MQGDQRRLPTTKQVLIVEDNELNMKLLRDVLDAYGYRTITTGEGEGAVALAREHQPDLILMDLQLPDISGLDAVRHLKNHVETQAIPIIAVTAFAMVGDERRALTGGCDAYLAKPVLLRKLLDLVRDFIGGGEQLRPGLAG